MAIFLGLDEKWKKYKTVIGKYINVSRLYILTNKSFSILILSAILIYFFWLDGLIIGSVLYIMVLLRELLNHKIRQDELNELDIHFFETANKNL